MSKAFKWFFVAFLFGIGETWYFGWNFFPGSFAEVGCDMFVLTLVIIGFVQTMIEEHEKKYHFIK